MVRSSTSSVDNSQRSRDCTHFPLSRPHLHVTSNPKIEMRTGHALAIFLDETREELQVLSEESAVPQECRLIVIVCLSLS